MDAGAGQHCSLMAPPALEPSATSFQGARNLVLDGNGGNANTWTNLGPSAECQGEGAEGGSLLMPTFQGERVVLPRGGSSRAWSHRAVKTPCFCPGRPYPTIPNTTSPTPYHSPFPKIPKPAATPILPLLQTQDFKFPSLVSPWLFVTIRNFLGMFGTMGHMCEAQALQRAWRAWRGSIALL